MGQWDCIEPWEITDAEEFMFTLMLFFMDLPEMKFALKKIGDRAGDQKRFLSLCRSVGVGIANVGKAQSLTKSLLFLLSSYVKETKQNNKQTNRSFLPLKKGWENVQSPDLWKFLTTTEEGKIIIKSPSPETERYSTYLYGKNKTGCPHLTTLSTPYLQALNST